MTETTSRNRRVTRSLLLRRSTNLDLGTSSDELILPTRDVIVLDAGQSALVI